MTRTWRNSSSASAAAFLLIGERSRWLMGWWIGLHLCLGLVALVPPVPRPVGWLLLVPLACHFRRRCPVRSVLLVVSPGGRFGLPAEGRFDLALTGRSRVARFWAELVFEDRPRSGLLLVRDQFTATDWRRLCIALREGT